MSAAPSNYRLKLWKDGCLEYLILTADSKVSFCKTKKEALNEIKKLPNYKHAGLWGAKCGNGRYLSIDMADYQVSMITNNKDDLLKYPSPFPFSRVYQEIKTN